MDRQVIPATKRPKKATVRPLTLGGTGAITAEAALTVLGGIPQSLVGQHNGIAPLDANSKIPIQFIPAITVSTEPMLKGPRAVATVGPFALYEITNYDSELPYTVSVNKGSVTRNGKMLSFVPPSTPGLTVLTVNGHSDSIDVFIPYVNKPSVLNLVNNATNVNLNRAMIVSGFFVRGDSDTNDETHWQISHDNGFTDLYSETTGAVANTYTPPKFALSTTYYIRVRQHGVLYGWSEWSDVVAFTTSNVDLPFTEVAIMLRPNIDTDPDTGSSFGSNMALSNDGTVMAVADFGARAVFIYKKIATNWIYQNLIVEDAFLSNGAFGESLIISNDNQTIFIGNGMAISPDGLINNVGAVCIFKTTIVDDYSNFTLSQTMYAPLTATCGNFGSSIAISLDNQTLAVAAGAQGSSLTQETFIYHFDETNGYQNLFSLENPNPTEWSYFSSFGENISMNAAGTLLIIGDQHGGPGPAYAGSLYVYEYFGNSWGLVTTLYPDQNIVPEAFSWPLQLSHDGNTIVCGNYYDAAPWQNSIYVFERINGTWTKTQKIDNPDWIDSALGGQAGAFRFSADDQYLLVSSPWQTADSSELDDWGSWNADGAAYLYRKINGVWTMVHKYIASDYHRNNNFGAAIALNQQVNEVIAGAPYRFGTSNIRQNGAIYIFR